MFVVDKDKIKFKILDIVFEINGTKLFDSVYRNLTSALDSKDFLIAKKHGEEINIDSDFVNTCEFLKKEWMSFKGNRKERWTFNFFYDGFLYTANSEYVFNKYKLNVPYEYFDISVKHIKTKQFELLLIHNIENDTYSLFKFQNGHFEKQGSDFRNQKSDYVIKENSITFNYIIYMWDKNGNGFTLDKTDSYELENFTVHKDTAFVIMNYGKYYKLFQIGKETKQIGIDKSKTVQITQNGYIFYVDELAQNRIIIDKKTLLLKKEFDTMCKYKSVETNFGCVIIPEVSENSERQKYEKLELDYKTHAFDILIVSGKDIEHHKISMVMESSNYTHIKSNQLIFLSNENIILISEGNVVKIPIKQRFEETKPMSITSTRVGALGNKEEICKKYKLTEENYLIMYAALKKENSGYYVIWNPYTNTKVRETNFDAEIYNTNSNYISGNFWEKLLLNEDSYFEKEYLLNMVGGKNENKR